MDHDVIGILIAMLCGAAVGLERQWSGHASGPRRHFAGLRTFSLLGGLCGAAGYLWLHEFQTLAAILLAGAVGMVVAAYAAVSRHDAEATTEVSGLVVAAAGVLAGLGHWELASGIAAITTLLLVEKSRLHSWAEGLSDTGIKAGFRFAIMAVVILPLLPEGPYGPLGGVRPRELWVLVLFFSGISFLACIIRSFVGPGRGYVLAGLLGGLISSTNVSLTFSRTSRKEEKAGISLALGVIAACTMMYFRVNITAAVLNPQLGLALIPYMAAPAVVGLGFTLWGFRRATEKQQEAAGSSNPLQLSSAIQMAVLFQIVLFAVTAIREHFGQPGMLLSGAALGLTDMDALVISMAKSGGDQVSAAALSTVVGTLSNTALKLGLVVVLGMGRFRSLAGAGLIALGMASAVVLAVWKTSSP